MKHKNKIALMLVLTSAAAAMGQCGSCSGGRCFAPGPQTRAALHEWRCGGDDDPGRFYLYADGQLRGGYDVNGQYYRPYDETSGVWGPKNPVVPQYKPDDKPKEFFGVDTSKLNGGENYTLHGDGGARKVSKQEAHQIVAAKLQDDSNKLRVTVIGDEALRKQVITDIPSLLKDIGDWAVLRGYAPGHWALEPGFVQTGSPTIYCQAPTGKVLHRQDNYDGGAEQLAEALRKAKSTYDPKKDPDLRKSALAPADNSKLLGYGIAAVIGAGAVHLATKRRAS